MEQNEDLLAEALAKREGRDLNKYPSMLVGNPTAMRTDELWRCGRCGAHIRTNADIKRGRMCKRCNSTMVIPAFPSLWETIVLFFRTGKIYLTERKRDEE